MLSWFGDVPVVLTGGIQLTRHLSFIHILVMAFNLIKSIAAFLLMLTLRLGSHAVPGASLSAFWLGSTVACFTILPLRNYDLSIVAMLLFFLPVPGIRGRIILVVTDVILHRARGFVGLVARRSDLLHPRARVSTLALHPFAGLTVSLLMLRRARMR